MNISRFFGSTNREALRQVRLALGPEALIVSNKRVNGGVEILATDPTSVASANEASAAQAGAPVAPQQARAPAPAHAHAQVHASRLMRPATPAPRMPAPAPAPMPEQGADVMDAIGAMRGALENRIDELLWGNQLRRAPQAVSLFQTLLGYGFSTALLRAMLKRLPDQLAAKAAFQWARNELITHLPVLKNEDELWTPGLVLALVGPTGVGKTTTIAKLAARCVRRSGPDSLVMITTDTYRIGAHEQLKIYGQILRVPVHVVQDAAELRQVVQTIRPDQTILIDNVGISQRDRYISEQAAMLAGAGRTVNRILVLNASSHGDTLDEVARTYTNDGGSPLKGCIITKVDEASRLGAALDTSIRFQLPIHYVSNGQKVPENLQFLQPTELIDQALVHNRESRALYAPTEADFAALMSLSKAPEDNSHAAAAESRRKRLLPGLISMAAEGGASLSMGDLDGARAYVEETTSTSEAYDLWRGYTAAKQDAATVASSVDHLIRVVQNDLSDGGHKHALALHDQVALRDNAGNRGSLRATLVLAANGKALASTMQQLSFADGWQSSCGASAQLAPTPGEALHHQVQWLNQRHPSVPFVHFFEGGTQAAWRKISALDVSWLAQCAATTRIEFDDSGTTVGALGKTLNYRPMAKPVYLESLTEIAGVPIEDTVAWVACEAVELAARQQDTLLLQLLSVRIVNRADGATIKTLYGLTNMFASTASPETIAGWLVLRAEAKLGMRYAGRAWQALAPRDDIESIGKALAVTQIGLAAWQARQDPQADSLRIVAGKLIGKPGLPSLTMVPAVLKLFALKEMMAD